MTFLTVENMFLAYNKAKKSRKSKKEVYEWDYNFELNMRNFKNDLLSKKYIHSEYKKIILTDSKKRYIHSPHFRDHILHHMIYAEIYKVFDKKLISQTYACRKWYGSHKAIKDIQNFCIKNSPKYYLKLDISKYFYSISHEKLKNYIFKFIKNSDLKYTINLVIDSYKTGKEFDNLLSNYDKYINTSKKWIPIWSILSQVFANIYLQKLDAFVKHTLKINGYFRYMDDLLLFWDKNELQNAKQKIIDFVDKELDLFINPKKVSFNLVNDGVNFVWFKILSNKIYVLKRTKLKILKFIDNLEKIDLSIFDTKNLNKIRSSYYSRLGNFKHSSFWVNFLKQRGNIDFHPWW